MAYTITVMEALIRSALKEPSQTSITSLDILRVLNDGQNDVAIKALCIEKVIYVTANKGEKIIPVDCLKVNYIRVDGLALFYTVGINLTLSGIAGSAGVPGVPSVVTGTGVIAEAQIAEGETLTVPGVPSITVSTVVV